MTSHSPCVGMSCDHPATREALDGGSSCPEARASAARAICRARTPQLLLLQSRMGSFGARLSKAHHELASLPRQAKLIALQGLAVLPAR
jgi:hypothetical protein